MLRSIRWVEVRQRFFFAILLSCAALCTLCVEGRTATRTPDELVCLPLVVDYEGYAVMAGIAAGVITVAVYVAVVRREGMQEAKRRRLEESEGHVHDDAVYERSGHVENDHGDNLSDEAPHGGTTASRLPSAAAAISLEAATDPAVREALRALAADDVPEPPPRR